MSLIGHSVPPIFRRGPAPLVRLMVFVAIALTMLVADLKFRYLEVMRQSLSVILYPVEMAAATPAGLVRNASTYFATLAKVQKENAELRGERLRVGERLVQFEQMSRENDELRGLLGMAQRLEARSVAAQVLYAARDPFSRKVILDRGATHGVDAGQAVVDATGVIGQVSRVYPIQSEVTLLTDKDQAIPVTVARNGLRGAVFGAGRGQLELRFLPANADVQPGDELLTSGLDGLYLPGLPVARVMRVERDSQAFARILCLPLGGVESSMRVLVLSRAEPLPPMPDPAEALPIVPEGRGAGSPAEHQGEAKPTNPKAPG